MPQGNVQTKNLITNFNPYLLSRLILHCERDCHILKTILDTPGNPHPQARRNPEYNQLLRIFHDSKASHTLTRSDCCDIGDKIKAHEGKVRKYQKVICLAGFFRYLILVLEFTCLWARQSHIPIIAHAFSSVSFMSILMIIFTGGIILTLCVHIFSKCNEMHSKGLATQFKKQIAEMIDKTNNVLNELKTEEKYYGTKKEFVVDRYLTEIINSEISDQYALERPPSDIVNLITKKL
jgi:hypothetical protein